MPVYTCEKCGKEFKYPSALKRHMNIKTPCKKVVEEEGIEDIKDIVENNDIIEDIKDIEDEKVNIIDEDFEDYKNNYVYQTMLTCIGNKRKIIPHITDIINEILLKENKKKINILDGFCGSSVVSRELTHFSNILYSNDLELYSYLMAKCFLQTPTIKEQNIIKKHIDKMNDIAVNGPYIEGIISKNYCPQNTNNIKEGERCFYTRENGLIIDTLREYISKKINKNIQVYCLVPLLTRASIHTNTAGVFKGFYKNNGIGCFGGKGKNALTRILKPIKLDYPIWNNYSSFKSKCFNKDINILINDDIKDIDLIYLDPPYNQHPYGSNYFMLNIIAKNEDPKDISKVSGIPKKWNKSNYNYRNTAIKFMNDLIKSGMTKSKYILLSYNNEGIIKKDDWDKIFKNYNVKKYEIKYDTYKGCRNLKNRDNKVIEIMYLISNN